MKLEWRRTINMTASDPSDHVVTHVVNVKADTGLEDDRFESRVVGRFLADELRRYQIEEAGQSVSDVADASSSGLEAAWSSLLDDDRDFRSEDFAGIAEPVVYVYRFALHPSFDAWKPAVVDAFCRSFDNDALIVFQRKGLVRFHFRCSGIRSA